MTGIPKHRRNPRRWAEAAVDGVGTRKPAVALPGGLIGGRSMRKKPTCRRRCQSSPGAKAGLHYRRHLAPVWQPDLPPGSAWAARWGAGVEVRAVDCRHEKARRD